METHSQTLKLQREADNNSTRHPKRTNTEEGMFLRSWSDLRNDIKSLKNLKSIKILQTLLFISFLLQSDLLQEKEEKQSQQQSSTMQDQWW
jgi:hypothetical protein